MIIYFSWFFPEIVVELPGLQLVASENRCPSVAANFGIENFTCWLAEQSRGCQRPLRRVWAPASRHWQDAHVLRFNDRRQLHHAHLVHFRGQGVRVVSRIARMTVFVTSLISHTTLLFFLCPVLAMWKFGVILYVCVGHASLLGTRFLTNCRHIHVETWPAMIQVFVACQRSIPTTLILPKPDLKSSGSIKTLEELTTQCRVDAASAKASVENDAIKIKKKIMEDSWDRRRFFEQDLILVQSNGPYGFFGSPILNHICFWFATVCPGPAWGIQDHESFDYVNQTVEKELCWDPWHCLKCLGQGEVVMCLFWAQCLSYFDEFVVETTTVVDAEGV